MARKQKSEGTSRLAQVRAAYSMTRRVDPKILPIILGTAVGIFVVFLGLGLLFHHPVYASVLGVLVGLLAATIVFGRRAERAAYAQVEGQPGAAAAVLNSLRRGWTVTPAVAVTPRGQAVVHRAVGRPGIVLIAEGPPNRVAGLLSAEKRKMARIAGETPIHEIVAGNEEGQVPLRRLQAQLMKLPRKLRPAEVSELNNRLRAVGERTLPIPKGPMPKGARMPRGKIR